MQSLYPDKVVKVLVIPLPLRQIPSQSLIGQTATVITTQPSSPHHFLTYARRAPSKPAPQLTPRHHSIAPRREHELLRMCNRVDLNQDKLIDLNEFLWIADEAMRAPPPRRRFHGTAGRCSLLGGAVAGVGLAEGRGLFLELLTSGRHVVLKDCFCPSFLLRASRQRRVFLLHLRPNGCKFCNAPRSEASPGETPPGPSTPSVRASGAS